MDDVGIYRYAGLGLGAKPGRSHEMLLLSFIILIFKRLTANYNIMSSQNLQGGYVSPEILVFELQPSEVLCISTGEMQVDPEQNLD